MLVLALSPAWATATALAQETPAGPEQRPSPQQVRAEIEQILASEEYQLEQKEKQQPTWLERAARAIARVLSGQLFAGLPPIASFGIVAGLLVLLGLIVYHVLTILRPALRRPAEAPEGRFVPDELLDKKPADLRKLAAEHAARGAYRAALRWTYVALLVALDRRGLIEYDHRRTNWEYLRQLERNSALFDPARELTLLFDRKWYGEQETTAGEYEQCQRLTEQALEALAA